MAQFSAPTTSKPVGAERILAQELLLNNADCLQRVFSFLRLRDRHNVELTCRYWRDISVATPLSPTTFVARYVRDVPACLYCEFGCYRWTTPYAEYKSADEDHIPDEDNNVPAVFRRLFNTYGSTISFIHFGGDLPDSCPVLLSPSYTAPVRPSLMHSIADGCVNLTSIAFKSVRFTGVDAWQNFGTMLDYLCVGGNLRQLCLHDVQGPTVPYEDLVPVARSLRLLQRFGYNSIPYDLVCSLGRTVLDDLESDQTSPSNLNELYIFTHHIEMVLCSEPDLLYMNVAAVAEKTRMSLTIRDVRDGGCLSSAQKLFDTMGYRLHELELRVWGAQSHSYESQQLVPILISMGPATSNLRVLSLYGADNYFNDQNFAMYMQFLSTCTTLRKFSFGRMGGQRLKDYRPLAFLVQLDELRLSETPRLTDEHLREILTALKGNLKKFLLRDAPLVDAAWMMQFLRDAARLEAVELSKCPSVQAGQFFTALLQEKRRAQVKNKTSGLCKNLAFVKVKGCGRGYDYKWLRRTVREFEKVGIRVVFAKYYMEAAFLLKDFGAWESVQSIAMPYGTCPYCETYLIG